MHSRRYDEANKELHVRRTTRHDDGLTPEISLEEGSRLGGGKSYRLPEIGFPF